MTTHNTKKVPWPEVFENCLTSTVAECSHCKAEKIVRRQGKDAPFLCDVCAQYNLASLRRELEVAKGANDILAGELAAANEARGKAEGERGEAQGKLCRARDALAIIASGTLDVTPPYRNAPASELSTVAKAALSSSAPCPHAEREKALNGVIDWILMAGFGWADHVAWRNEIERRRALRESTP